MTHLLFIPDDQTFIMLDSPLSPDELAVSINSGQWAPPPAIATLLKAGSSLKAACFGKLVLALLAKPPELPVTKAGPSGQSRYEGLSPRQDQILHCLIEGLTTQQIALRLGLHPRTVQYHISLIKTYFQAGTRAESIGRAMGSSLFKGHGAANAKLAGREKSEPDQD
jgi:DNA-binding CsgD family transcriptional regulator